MQHNTHPLCVEPLSIEQQLNAALERINIGLPVPYTELSPQVLNAQSVEVLFKVQSLERTIKNVLGALSGVIHAAKVARYEEQAKAQLLDQGKESGTIHLHDGDLKVKVELKKTVSWDQEQLAVIAERIAAAGDDPREWIDAQLSVSESKYKAWSQAMRETFAPARTVKTAKSTITLVRREGR